MEGARRTSGVRKTQAPSFRAMLMQYLALERFSSSVRPTDDDTRAWRMSEGIHVVGLIIQKTICTWLQDALFLCLDIACVQPGAPAVTNSQLTARGSMAAHRSIRKRPSETDGSLSKHQEEAFTKSALKMGHLSVLRNQYRCPRGEIPVRLEGTSVYMGSTLWLDLRFPP